MEKIAKEVEDDDGGYRMEKLERKRKGEEEKIGNGIGIFVSEERDEAVGKRMQIEGNEVKEEKR